MRPVDKQQYLLYDAQWEAFRGSPLHAPLSTSECIGITGTLFARARDKGYWFSSYLPRVEFVDKTALGGSFSGTATWWVDKVEGSYISLTPDGKRGWLLAHEAAHILLMAGRPQHKLLEPHGKEYAAVFIWAVSALFGIKWSNRLKRAFAEARVEAVCSLTED